jgi:mRNA interferase MazF
MKTGDIVLIPFPFSELTNIKVRPAVVITTTKDKFEDIVLCAVSSQVPSSLSANEIILQPNSVNGLKLPSVLKVDRIFTLKAEKVIFQLGRLELKKFEEFKEIFRNLVN